MDEEVAKSLLSLSKGLDGPIGQMFVEVERIHDEKLKARFKRAVGDLMGYVARDLIFPIETLHPKLRAE